MSANARLALASGFNGGSGGDDGGGPRDPRIERYYQSIMSASRGTRSTYTNPHEVLSTLDRSGHFIDAHFIVTAEGRLIDIPREPVKGRDIAFSGPYVEIIKEQLHLRILKQQQKNANKDGYWTKGDLKDIEVCLAHNGGDNPMAKAFKVFADKLDFAQWLEKQKITDPREVVVTFSKPEGQVVGFPSAPSITRG